MRSHYEPGFMVFSVRKPGEVISMFELLKSEIASSNQYSSLNPIGFAKTAEMISEFI